MESAPWFIFIGLLLLGRGLTSTMLASSPFSSSIFYLMVGVCAGPMMLNLFHFNPLIQSPLLETLTEVAVLISLFSAGIKMPVPFTLKRWRAPILLAWLSMTLMIAMVAAMAYYVLALPLGAAVLLGAILAPTDPVLATDVQSRHPGDNDQLRFTLTSEAGMNDGSAFPFVMLGLGLLGLHDLGDRAWEWAAFDVIWAIAAALALGIAGGIILAHLGWRLRTTESPHEVLDDLVGLGLIALVYGLSIWVQAYGFLAVFFAGVALRQTELKLFRRRQQQTEAIKPAEALPSVASDHELQVAPTYISTEALIFKEHLERLSEMMLVLLLGGMLSVHFWQWPTVGLAAFLFVIARPLSVFISLAGTSMSFKLKSMIGWFGVRGIGSIYYLMYAIQHGLPDPLAVQLTQFTLVVITLSIVVHGTSVKPLMNKFWRKKIRHPSQDAT